MESRAAIHWQPFVFNGVVSLDPHAGRIILVRPRLPVFPGRLPPVWRRRVVDGQGILPSIQEE